METLHTTKHRFIRVYSALKGKFLRFKNKHPLVTLEFASSLIVANDGEMSRAECMLFMESIARLSYGINKSRKLN